MMQPILFSSSLSQTYLTRKFLYSNIQKSWTVARKTAKKVQNNLLLLCGVTKIFNYVFLVSNTNVMIEFPSAYLESLLTQTLHYCFFYIIMICFHDIWYNSWMVSALGKSHSKHTSPDSFNSPPLLHIKSQ